VDAEHALADLMEISSQVEAAVLLDPAGAVLASAGGGERLAATAAEALEAAAAPPGPAPIQLEVSARGGSLFVVRDGDRTIAATTPPEPTAGLVLYDLRTAHRRLGEEPRPTPRRRRKAATKADGDAPA
jgi:predicted regulator of Ras-like GTPase activity (Roadblock/LC7/MglB family)